MICVGPSQSTMRDAVSFPGRDGLSLDNARWCTTASGAKPPCSARQEQNYIPRARLLKKGPLRWPCVSSCRGPAPANPARRKPLPRPGPFRSCHSSIPQERAVSWHHERACFSLEFSRNSEGFRGFSTILRHHPRAIEYEKDPCVPLRVAAFRPECERLFFLYSARDRPWKSPHGDEGRRRSQVGEVVRGRIHEYRKGR